MNTINNKFSFARLGAVLKCDLVEHRWSNIAAFFILFAAFLASQLANMNSIIGTGLRHSIQPDQYMPSLAANFVPFFYGVLSLTLMCAAADMCGVPLKTKGRGLNYLMMPATNMEKFVARALVNTILLIVMAFAALLLADLVRMLFVPLFEVKEFYGFTLPRILGEIGETFSAAYSAGGEVWGLTADGTIRVTEFSAYYGVVNVTAMVAAFLFAHSLFILGGCIWRKAAIIKIWITQIVVTSAVVWIFVKLEPYVLPWLSDVLTSLFETEQRAGMTLMSIAIPVLLALTALNWWLGYRLFSRKQVVAPQHLRGGKHLHQLFPSRK
ncbi:MAG: hypothetical protein IJ290_08230 [Bacteroidaceae bacterium]|nr:hypothetical protein [Bacteroidaceae bacterium]